MNLAGNFIDSKEIELRRQLARRSESFIIHRGDKRFYDFSRTNPVKWEDAPGFLRDGASARILADKDGVTGQGPVAGNAPARPSSGL